MIPALQNKSVEFYAVAENRVHAFHDGRIWRQFKKLPRRIHGVIRQVMNVTDASIREMEKFVFEKWGGLDNRPDIDENGNVCLVEYSSHDPKFDNGLRITPAQLRVLELIDLPAFNISNILCLSEYTVNRHVADMASNSGLTTKELVKWATEKGII
jgi:hypothetical protein